MGYTKLFNEIIMSTIWREPDHVRLLWITMLAIKDRWHIVNASLPGLADSARITMNQCDNALTVLSSPDPYSRTKEHDGRRIEQCDGGWMILNGEKYRNKMSRDERREYNRLKQKEYRERKKSVKSCVQLGTECTHTDTDTDTKAKEDKHKNTLGSLPKKNVAKKLECSDDFLAAWEIYPKRAGANPKRRAFQAWSARTKQGTATIAMHDGVNRYSAFVRASGKVGTEFVMQAATFFGPDEHYLNDWNAPKQRPEDARPRNDGEWSELGKSVSVLPRPGESMPAYIKRIKGRIRDDDHA